MKLLKNKINDTYSVIPLNISNNTLGPNRHFPVSSKEWYNSLYAYNNNSLRNLNTKDNQLSRLVQSYFNIYFHEKILHDEEIIHIRHRRLELDKIFVGKAELKHTNDKVIINLNIFNQQKFNLINNMDNLIEIILSSSRRKSSRIMKKLNLYSNMPDKSLANFMENFTDDITNDIELEKSNSTLLKGKALTEKLLEINELESSLNEINQVLPNIKAFLANKELEKDNNALYKKFAHKALLTDEIESFTKDRLLMDLNRSKFEYNFINRLRRLISGIYKKEIELNIVNLNSIYLDVGILTQVIAIKLKNRDNSPLRTIDMAVNIVKVPSMNKYKYGTSHNQIWVNNIKTLNLNSLINKYNKNKDSLNKILLNVIPNPQKISSSSTQNLIKSKLRLESLNILDIVNKSIKYRKIRGIRLEVKGRLSRRFTAARSVFKLKWKGGLKNVDSSYRGYSSTILRGHVRSNVQHSISVNHNQIGAYGVKGWISGKE